jgi:hypothetical protein
MMTRTLHICVFQRLTISSLLTTLVFCYLIYLCSVPYLLLLRFCALNEEKDNQMKYLKFECQKLDEKYKQVIA